MKENEIKKLAVVTGGAGFVGSHLCERLITEGWRVISLDNYFTGTVENHVDGVEYREGHTKNIAAHITEKPDVLFHLGEYARTEKSFEDIGSVWDLNKSGTFAVLEFCRQRDVKIIYAGSSTKFADGGDGRDQSPYAWAKATNTELVQNYARWFGLRYAIVYFYNVYGPREMSGPYGTLIRIFTELYRTGRPLTITSPGTQTRNFTHVSDIVAGIMLVAEHGMGDGYGIGADESFSVNETAALFGGETILMPERAGNRQSGGVENEKVKVLGWQQKHVLPEWIKQVKEEIGSVQQSEQRILVFSTTFLPDAGPAELALYDLMQSLPNIQFDVITTVFSPEGASHSIDLPNVTLHRVGSGMASDKYRMLTAGAARAQDLAKKHSYIFTWSLFASYGALAALRTRHTAKLPLLITLADQNVSRIPWHLKLPLKFLLREADQVYASDAFAAKDAATLAERTTLTRSIGDGDAFANQIRFAYNTFLKQRAKEVEK